MLFNFVIGLSTVLFPAILFLLYDFHKKDQELRAEFNQRLGSLTIESNRAKAKTTSLEKKLSISDSKISRLESEKENLEAKLHSLSQDLISETLATIVKGVSVHNLDSSKQKLRDAIKALQRNGIDFDQEFKDKKFEQVQLAYDEAMRREGARLERERMKQRLRDEKKALEERDKQIQRLEKEFKVIESALEKALKKQLEHHQGEIEWLTSQLDDVKSKLDRAQSRADRSSVGYIYIASNVGSFGEGVYTLGMTKRLEPMDVVKELGETNAVPFPFDIHMIVQSEKAAELELHLNKSLASYRLNKVDSKKPFFQVELEKIKSLLEESEAQIEYQTSVPEAIEYRESRSVLEELAEKSTDEENFKKAA